MFKWNGSRRWFVGGLGAVSTAIIAGCKQRLASGQAAAKNFGDPKARIDPKEDGEYDYIIIGSGAGGGPLAANLANAGKTVLLIEAGADCGESNNYKLPYFNAAALEDPAMCWEFFVKHYSDENLDKRDAKRHPESVSLAGESTEDGVNLADQRKGVQYPRAGTLGGCTAHNAMITVYPHESDWRELAELTGDQNYAPEKMRQYFQFVERNAYLHDVPGNDDGMKKKGHGLTGWLQTERFNPQILADKGDFRLLALLKGALLAFGEKGISAATETAARFRAALGNVEKLRQEGNNLVKEMGPILNRDVNALFPGRDSAEGVFRVPLATNGGRRNGTRDLLLATAKKNNKLKIQMETFVTRLVFDDEKDADGKLVARGVEYIKGAHLYRASRKPQAIPEGERTIVKARYEVIVSCGAFNTPQLLMLSGIGPKSQIGTVGDVVGTRQGGTLAGDAHSKGQKVLMNLEGVGKNLQDRYEACVVTSTGLPFELIRDCKFTGMSAAAAKTPDEIDPCMTQWEQKPTAGPYSTDGSLICFLKKSSVAENNNVDLAVIGYAGVFAGYKRGSGDDFIVVKDQQGNVVKDNDGNPTLDLSRWTWQLIKVHNRNRAGSVELRTTNPWDTPIINFRHFDDGKMTEAAQKDLQGVVEGLKLLRKVQSAGEPMLSVFHPIEEVLPGTKPASPNEPQVLGRGKFNTDAELGQFVKDNTWGHHASCTCPMLPAEEGGVVNGQFQVHGVARLRIVDASIFPKTPGIFIVTPIYMMSEKATDDILESIGANRRIS